MISAALLPDFVFLGSHEVADLCVHQEAQVQSEKRILERRVAELRLVSSALTRSF